MTPPLRPLNQEREQALVGSEHVPLVPSLLVGVSFCRWETLLVMAPVDTTQQEQALKAKAQ